MDLKNRETVNGLIRKIMSGPRIGLVMKNYRRLFTLLDDAFTNAPPSCCIMPMVAGNLQVQHVEDTLSEIWPSERDAIRMRTNELLTRWQELCKASGSNQPIMDIVLSDWVDMSLLCPMRTIEKEGGCHLQWRRPQGCLSTNPAFNWLSSQIDNKLYGLEEVKWRSLLDVAHQYLEEPSSSRIALLPKRSK